MVDKPFKKSLPAPSVSEPIIYEDELLYLRRRPLAVDLEEQRASRNRLRQRLLEEVFANRARDRERERERESAREAKKKKKKNKEVVEIEDEEAER